MKGFLPDHFRLQKEGEKWEPIEERRGKRYNDNK
jgi:hypothetical protein